MDFLLGGDAKLRVLVNIEDLKRSLINKNNFKG